MAGEATSISEAAGNAAQAVEDAARVAEAQTANMVDDVLADAAARVEQAELTAEQIAAAAVESERGRRIETVEQETRQCRAELNGLSSELTQLREQLATFSQQMAALAGVTVRTALSSNPQSIPLASDESLTQEAEALTEAILPVEVSDQSANTPVALAPRKARRLL